MTIYLILSHIIVAILAFIICCFWQKRKPKTCIEMGDYNSSALISDDATRVLVDKFHSTLNESFDPILIPASTDPFTEAALAYVTFEDLKKYMCFIENLSIKNGLLNVNNLGIRMYYGRYPYTSQELQPYKKNNVVDESVVGRHTLVFVPTFRDGTRDIDFNPHHIEKGCPMRILEIRDMKRGKQKQQEPEVASRQSLGIDTTSSSGAGTSTTNNTGVNLNTFGLTPPKNNTSGDASYTP